MSGIHWLGVDECHDAGIVGGKAAALSRLAALHRVPPGFAIPATPSYSRSIPPAVEGAVRDGVPRAGEALGDQRPAGGGALVGAGRGRRRLVVRRPARHLPEHPRLQ